MEPAGYRREHPPAAGDQLTAWARAAMEPAGYRREHIQTQRSLLMTMMAAMEPAGYRREHT